MSAESDPRRLGHGVGLRRQHFSHLLEHGPQGADWMEIVSENFFEPGGRPWAVLERVRGEVPVVMHGVSMGIGNADGVDREYLDRLDALARRLEPALISDHLCWTGFGGHQSHDLLPLPYNEETLEHCVTQVSRVQDKLQRQLLVENPSSYVAFRASDMTEAEFLAELAGRADCHLLLDVNNVHVSSQNHGFSATEYLDAIPVDRVKQLHLAGHTDQGTFLLDSHVGPVPEPVWALYRRWVERAGAVPTLVEWDAEVPDYATVLAEAQRAAREEREVLDVAS